MRRSKVMRPGRKGGQGGRGTRRWEGEMRPAEEGRFDTLAHDENGVDEARGERKSTRGSRQTRHVDGVRVGDEVLFLECKKISKRQKGYGEEGTWQNEPALGVRQGRVRAISGGGCVGRGDGQRVGARRG
jgi:hypothetical protein